MSEQRYRIALREGITTAVLAALDGDTNGLRTRIEAIARAVGGGGGGGVVKPRIDGTWPRQERVDGDGDLWWLRHITPDRLADPPTTADGYRDGDFIHPALTDNPTPTSNVLWSDSFTVDANADFTSRVGDAYAGGAAPTWIGDTSQRVADGRVRVMTAGKGLNIYSNVWAFVDSPAIPSGASWTFTARLTEFAAQHRFSILLRGDRTDPTARTQVSFLGAVGAITVHLDTPDSPRATIGDASFTEGSSILKVRSTPDAVTVTVDDTLVGTAIVPNNGARASRFTLHAHDYSPVSMMDTIFEVDPA